MIKLIVFDIDGTFTDGKRTYTEEPDYAVSVDIKDRFGIKKAMLCGKILVAITGSPETLSLVHLLECDLRVDKVFYGCLDKWRELKKYLDWMHIDPSEVAYMGDDDLDVECIKNVGIGACPRNAMESVRKSASWISKFDGGNGALRELIEICLKVRM